jgi:hypothetical protein
MPVQHQHHLRVFRDWRIGKKEKKKQQQQKNPNKQQQEWC